MGAVGMTGGEPVADFVFGIDAWQQNDAIDVLPLIAQFRLQRQLVAHAGEPHHFVRRILLEISG